MVIMVRFNSYERSRWVALVGTGIARIDMVIIDMATAHARSIVARQAKTKRQRDCQISNQRTFQNGTQKIFKYLQAVTYMAPEILI